LIGVKFGIEKEDDRQLIQTRNKIQKGSSKRAPVRLDGVEKAKSSDNDTGILLKDPFLSASHYWPFEDIKENLLSADIVTGHNAIFLNGSTVSEDHTSKLTYATTDVPGSSIILGDFNGTCFSDPGKCILGGLTLSFWINLDRERIREDQDAYIFSGGGQSKESRGFGFLFFHGDYVFVLSIAAKQWKMTIPESKVKTGKWENIVFVWEKSGNLTYYANGEKIMSIKGNDAKRPNDKYTLITIGKPNNADSREYMYPLKIRCIGFWDKALKSDQVKDIYIALKDESKKRRLSKKFLVEKLRRRSVKGIR